MHVCDIARAYGASLTSDIQNWEGYNLGSDEVVTIAGLAEKLAKA